MRAVDLDGPAYIRQAIETGPTAVMKSAWRDPDDTRPNAARKAREICGWRTYCPLRRMMLNKGSQIEPRHVYAADFLRSEVDLAVIGRGARSMEALYKRGYGPVAGPARSALDGVYAMAGALRAIARLAPSTRLLVAEIVLRNNSIHAWCRIPPRKDPKIEMGKLIAALDILADHYAADIDEALSRGRVMEVEG